MPALRDSIVNNLLFSKSVNFTPVRVDGRRIVAGYANVADVVDSQNEKVTKDALDRAWQKFSSNPKFCVSQLFHTNIPIASILLEPIIDSDNVTHKSGVDERGLYIVAEVRDDIKIANEVWDKIMVGKIRGFSIGGEYLSPPTPECVGGQCHNRVDNIELHEVSIVDSPANKVSLFNVLKNDSLSKLGELTSKIEDEIIFESAVEVSKHPYPDGNYGVFFNVPMTVKDGRQFTIPNGFKIVSERCPNNEWIGLYDLALLRPYSAKGEVLTGSVPGGFKDAPLLDKPSEEGSTLNTEKSNVENIVNPKVEVQPEQTPVTAPPVEDKKPLTLEILAADFARFSERLINIEGLLTIKAKPKDEAEDEEEDDEDKKKPKDKEDCGCSKIEKSDKPATATAPEAPITTTTVTAPTPVSTVTATAPVETPKPVDKPVATPTQEPTPTPAKVEVVKAPEPVKEQPQVVSSTKVPPPKVEEDTVVFRGQATPKQVDTGRVDLLRLYNTPWGKLSGDE